MSANSSATKVDLWLTHATIKLSACGIATARLDVLVLLEDVTGKDRSWLLAHPKYKLSKSIEQKLNEKIERRCTHEPLAYIRGKSEFYGREFIVNTHTLEPRPETETIIELFLEAVDASRSTSNKLTVFDVGTGSGVIAITVKLERPEIDVIAIDIDKKCLEIAAQNAKKHRTEIDFHYGNLLKPLSIINYQTSNIVVLANLPYVPENFKVNSAAQHEPKHAIFGGKDGLSYYRELFKQAKKLTSRPHFIFTEALPPQHNELKNIAETAGYKQARHHDFIQVFE